jgi:hypothetical protein
MVSGILLTDHRGELTRLTRYVLSPTHLHEFKSADRIASQAPIMSLYLPEQKLGSHSEPGSSSHKFMLKGRQTGGMHRGHAWVFRAESYDTMMAWFADIKELTEKSGKERDAFVRRTHARSLSGGSGKAHSIGGSSDGGLEEDEADAQPYSSEQSIRGAPAAAIAGSSRTDHQYGSDTQADDRTSRHGDEQQDAAGWRPTQRPSPGGRFPSELNMHRGLQAPVSPSSGESSTERDRDAIAAAGALPGSGMPMTQSEVALQQPASTATDSRKEKTEGRVGQYDHNGQRRQHNTKAREQRGRYDYDDREAEGQSHVQSQRQSSFTQPQQASQQQQYVQPQEYTQHNQQYTQPQQEVTQSEQQTRQTPSQFTTDSYLDQSQRDYAAPAAAAGVGGATLGAAAMYHYNQTLSHQQEQQHAETVTEEMDHAAAVPVQGTSSAPIMTDASTAMSPTALTNTNTNTNPRPVSSSQGDTISLSTVPTSLGSVNNSVDSSQQQGQQIPDSQSAGAATTTTPTPQPLTEVERDDGNVTTKPVPLRTMTAGTISDLHIPGEFPRTPRFAQ